MEIFLIAAVAENGVIGAGGAMPWRLKSDMARLKAMTMGKPVVVTHSFADAKLIATGDALRRFATEIAVIGGSEIYAQWMDSADRLEITEVHARPDGDTRFPAIDPTAWEEVARVRNPAGSHDSADFSYVTFRRRRKR